MGVIPWHYHLRALHQFHRSSYIGRPEVKLGPIAAEKRGVAEEALLSQSDLGDPMGVAKILAWLAGDEADYVRGVLTTR